MARLQALWYARFWTGLWLGGTDFEPKLTVGSESRVCVCPDYSALNPSTMALQQPPWKSCNPHPNDQNRESRRSHSTDRSRTWDRVRTPIVSSLSKCTQWSEISKTWWLHCTSPMNRQVAQWKAANENITRSRRQGRETTPMAEATDRNAGHVPATWVHLSWVQRGLDR